MYFFYTVTGKNKAGNKDSEISKILAELAYEVPFGHIMTAIAAGGKLIFQSDCSYPLGMIG